MASSPRDILRRIRGIRSTQQITKAMEMVAAVKLNRVRVQAENSRPYVNNIGKIMRALCSSAADIDHPLFISRPVKKRLIVVITSDRGLCGTFNANVINTAKNLLEEKSDVTTSLITIGRKGSDALQRTGCSIERSYDVPWGDAVASQVGMINSYLTEAFQTERVDAVYLLYSHFDNVLKHVPTVTQHLPIPRLSEEEKKAMFAWAVTFIIEPSMDEIAEQLIPRYLETQFYHAIIESLASEHAARMVAMRNANDNAAEVIDALTLSYNKARQATITRELIDIIGGVEALKG